DAGSSAAPGRSSLTGLVAKGSSIVAVSAAPGSSATATEDGLYPASAAARNIGDGTGGGSAGTASQGSLGYGETGSSEGVSRPVGASSFSLMASSHASCSSSE